LERRREPEPSAREVFPWRAPSRRDRAKETTQNDSEIRFQVGRAEARDLLGNTDLRRRDATRTWCQKWRKSSCVGQGGQLLKTRTQAMAMAGVSSITHGWAAAEPLCAHGLV